MPLRIPSLLAPASATIAPLPASRIHVPFVCHIQRPHDLPPPSGQHHRPPIYSRAFRQPCLHRRAFHAGARLLRRTSPLDSKNHYQRLNLEPSASPHDIKKSFYSLSKIHHPDANPSDPDAASTFSLLSESYTILSDPSRRATYDRDVLHLDHHPPTPHSHHPHASYHSTNPAGGRAPSGLSRRRGTFRGPPPSFFRSGGYGPHADKRRKAHDDSTAGAASSFSSPSQNPDDPHASNPNPDARPGMGPGADPFHFHRHFHGNDDVPPYFDRAGHTRTHQREDVRRARRSRTALGDDGLEFEPQTSLVGHFFIVAGILAATFLAPVAYLQVMRLGGRKNKDGD